jgi:hypothetical protein
MDPTGKPWGALVRMRWIEAGIERWIRPTRPRLPDAEEGPGMRAPVVHDAPDPHPRKLCCPHPNPSPAIGRGALSCGKHRGKSWKLSTAPPQKALCPARSGQSITRSACTDRERSDLFRSPPHAHVLDPTENSVGSAWRWAGARPRSDTRPPGPHPERRRRIKGRAFRAPASSFDPRSGRGQASLRMRLEEMVSIQMPLRRRTPSPPLIPPLNPTGFVPVYTPAHDPGCQTLPAKDLAAD